MNVPSEAKLVVSICLQIKTEMIVAVTGTINSSGDCEYEDEAAREHSLEYRQMENHICCNLFKVEH